jgi:hypothetical protein
MSGNGEGEDGCDLKEGMEAVFHESGFQGFGDAEAPGGWVSVT